MKPAQLQKAADTAQPPQADETPCAVTTFTALDFETATGYRNSICQTGVARVVDGIVIDRRSWFSMPPDNYYWRRFTDDIHGISSQTTADAPTFDDLWLTVKPYITDQDVVAHNSVFDFGCLRATLTYYGIPTPNYRGHCTYRLLRSNLASLCSRHHIALDHHDALSDAVACAHLFMIAQGLRLREA